MYDKTVNTYLSTRVHSFVVTDLGIVSILNLDLNNINLDNNFDEDDPGTIIQMRLLPCYINFEKCKVLLKRQVKN